MAAYREHTEDLLRLYSSLNKAVCAYGVGELLEWDHLSEMSVRELFALLAPNHIKFTYTQPVKMPSLTAEEARGLMGGHPEDDAPDDAVGVPKNKKGES